GFHLLREGISELERQEEVQNCVQLGPVAVVPTPGIANGFPVPTAGPPSGVKIAAEPRRYPTLHPTGRAGRTEGIRILLQGQGLVVGDVRDICEQVVRDVQEAAIGEEATEIEATEVGETEAAKAAKITREATEVEASEIGETEAAKAAKITREATEVEASEIGE